MKIAVFENEYALVEAIFNSVNIFYFNNTLEFTIFPSSQSIGSLEELSAYDMVLVDLDLSQKSDLDGYSLLYRINALPQKPFIAIITGASKVKEALIQKKLPDVPIISKPPSIQDFYQLIKMVP